MVQQGGRLRAVGDLKVIVTNKAAAARDPGNLPSLDHAAWKAGPYVF